MPVTPFRDHGQQGVVDGPGWCSSAGLLSFDAWCAAGWGCRWPARCAVWQPVAVACICLPPPRCGIFLGTFARSMAQFGAVVDVDAAATADALSACHPHARGIGPNWCATVMLAGTNTHFVMLAQGGILFRGAHRSRLGVAPVSSPAACIGFRSSSAWPCTLPQLDYAMAFGWEGGSPLPERRFTTAQPITHRPRRFAAPCQGFGARSGLGREASRKLRARSRQEQCVAVHHGKQLRG